MRRRDSRSTVLLDLDGTLVDSAALITEHLAAALAGVGAPVPDAAGLRRLVGPPFEVALPRLGLTAAQAAAAVAAYRASYDPVAATGTPLYPGTRELLAALRAAEFALAVATSKPEPLARAIVEHTGLGIAVVAGADHPGGRVGKAAVVASALARLGLDPARAPVVMVGDRVHDVEGAAAHGVPTIGVRWGYAEPGELAGAVAVVDDVRGLLAALTEGTAWSCVPAAG
ncbi:MAG: HAD-IA family hydrolase [Pseudonocardia sp.]